MFVSRLFYERAFTWSLPNSLTHGNATQIAAAVGYYFTTMGSAAAAAQVAVCTTVSCEIGRLRETSERVVFWRDSGRGCHFAGSVDWVVALRDR